MDQKGLKLTDELIAALQPQGRTAVLWDTEVVNFGVEITPDGAMAFVVELPREGAGRQTLGRPGDVDVQSARQRARALLREAAISRSATRSMTVAEVCDLYLNEALLASKPRVIANAHGVLENHVKPLLGWKPLDALEHADGYRLLKQVSEGRTAAQRRGCRNVVGGRGAANMALRLLSAAVSFAARRGQVRGNPLLGVRKFKQNRPGRPLSHAEYKRLAQAIAASRRFGLESPYALAGVQLLMLTGCRRGEIESLTWDAVDRRRGHLHLRDSKSGDKSVPVGAEVLELL